MLVNSVLPYFWWCQGNVMLSQDITVPIKISSHGKIEVSERVLLCSRQLAQLHNGMSCAHLGSVKRYLKHIKTDKLQSTEKREGKSPTSKGKQGRTVLVISEVGEEVKGGWTAWWQLVLVNRCEGACVWGPEGSSTAQMLGDSLNFLICGADSVLRTCHYTLMWHCERDQR